MIFKLDNKIQNYEWGSYDFIANLLGNKISEKPQAELWMGTHPKGESSVIYENKKITLSELIAKNPAKYLGENIIQQFGENLPFLFKILVAKRPLSIQLHPNLQQAKNGFEMENKNQIALDDFARNYKDANHKPELICALTEFDAMCGFRAFDEIIERLKYLEISHYFNLANLQSFFENLLKIETKKEKLITKILAQVSATKPRSENEKLSFEWVLKLAKFYPQDLGVIAPLYLNIFRLKPGEALHLKTGVIHSYLKGAGVEIMANSDNVLRCGLTPKNIDISALLQVVKYDHKKIEILKFTRKTDENIYQTDASEFQLSNIVLNGKYNLKSQNPSILLCTEGAGKINDKYTIEKGDAFFIPFEEQEVFLHGKGLFYRANIP